MPSLSCDGAGPPGPREAVAPRVHRAEARVRGGGDGSPEVAGQFVVGRIEVHDVCAQAREVAGAFEIAKSE